VADVLRNCGMENSQNKPILDDMISHRTKQVDIMMRFELELEAPNPMRVRLSALAIGLSYIVGGFILLSSYIIIHDLFTALVVSVNVTLLAIFLFGFVKRSFTGTKPLKSGLQLVSVG
jgi:vacuolar iron transporter family protein